MFGAPHCRVKVNNLVSRINYSCVVSSILIKNLGDVCQISATLNYKLISCGVIVSWTFLASSIHPPTQLLIVLFTSWKTMFN